MDHPVRHIKTSKTNIVLSYCVKTFLSKRMLNKCFHCKTNNTILTELFVAPCHNGNSKIREFPIQHQLKFKCAHFITLSHIIYKFWRVVIKPSNIYRDMAIIVKPTGVNRCEIIKCLRLNGGKL